MTAATRAFFAFVVLALVPLLVHGAVPFRVCEDAKQQQVAQGGRTEVQLVYNENRREYFSVHLFYEGHDQASVVGQRFDERGSPVGELIPIFPWRQGQPISQHKKQFPVVAYNNNTDTYLVAWEFDFNGNGVDWDVVARAVSGAGVPLGPGAFFLASSFGREDSPHLAFSPKDNNFVLVHEVDDRMGTRGISVLRLNETHSIGQPILLNTSYIDREPFLAYHPPSNDFLLVWDWDQNNDNKTEIGALLVGGNPIVARSSVPNLVGSTVESIGGVRTLAHDHDAQLAYSPKQDAFLLTWEVDGDSGEKEVVCSLVSSKAKATGIFKVVGNASHPFDRKPTPVYSSFSDEFFIAYESGPNAKSTGIEGVAFAAKDLSADTEPFAVSQALDREHAPAVALSTTCGNIFTLWSSETSLSRRSLPAAQAKKPVATFAQQATAHLQAREENSGLTVRAYAPRSKFSTGLRADETAAVAHVYLPADFPSKVRSAAAAESADEATVEPRSSTASLQAVRVCLPGRGSCSAAGTPLPAPSASPAPKPTKDEGGGSNAMGVVLGLLGAAVVLAGLGVGGYVGWRRFPQIREWWEARRSGAHVLGTWAEESEFSISVDAFSNDDSGAADDDEHH